ncbi:NUDIX hydrolase [Rhodoferax aquaticus]|uniref:NUDIX domain-containing protein n=1 Tax=Rhodoferax aquaticus TaxID=2527691 RepID=A0A515ESZ4_9BURK|nr:NUDIX domain-containing protein [Rhodoferax aquaticus]QDL55790.1 NUDIX domain-containing protein [Rhodoferax aquaticus]
MVTPILTVDTVLLTIVDSELCVALHQREAAPFAGHWALPGGFIHTHEDDSAKAAAARVLEVKAGVRSPYLEEFGTFSGPVRDPRGWSMTVVYFALVPVVSQAAAMFPVNQLPNLPFDHSQIVSGVVQRVRSKASYSSLPVFLCPTEFTIAELHATYEVVQNEAINIANFRRKLADLDVLEPVPGALRTAGRSRPSQIYRLKKRYKDALSVRERGI